MAATHGSPEPIADLSGFERLEEQKAWYWYDWANSAYVTTVATVLFAPYLTAIAENDACGDVDDCGRNVGLLGLSIAPGSLVFYVITFATVFSAIVLPIVGAVADRSGRKKHMLAGFAWAGSAAAGAMFFVTGSNWHLGALLLIVAALCLGASLVVYNAILIQIALPDERDRVSSRGWAMGYLGGFVLLSINLAVVTLHESLGLSEGMAVRLSLVSAGIWWAAFTIIPFRGLKNRPPVGVEPASGGVVRQSFGQLFATLRHMRQYPMTLLFLVAYLFYNDGIQTVIVSSSVYGKEQLGFGTSVLIATILLVQFVAFFGALLFGRIAYHKGSRATVLGGLAVWMLVVVIGFFLPEESLVPFLAMAVLIGIVLGGTQALSRSLFSQLVPKGKEAEYFSLYEAAERGTSWLGTLVFGVVHQVTGSYRPAIFALIVFFAVGMVLLARLDVRRGIDEAGNAQPVVI
jgi:UMF1 family MFS transporter